MKRYVLVFLAVVFLVGQSFAGEYSTGATSAQFLKIGIGTRQTSMGSAYAGVADDVDTIYWNNGGLGFIESKEVSLTNLNWFADITLQNLTYAHPLGEGSGVLGVGYVQLAVQDIERYSSTGEPEGTFTANDSMITLAYGKTFDELGESLFGSLDDSCRLSAGMTLKIISLKIDEDNTSGYAADIGALCKLEDSGVNIGLTVQNLGTEMKFLEDGESFQLPTIGRLGVAYTELLEGNLILAMDINFPNDYRENVALGGEYFKELSDNFNMAVRAGYSTTTDLSGFCLGIGMVYKENYGLDIGYAPQGDLGNGIRISLSGKF